LFNNIHESTLVVVHGSSNTTKDQIPGEFGLRQTHVSHTPPSTFIFEKTVVYMLPDSSKRSLKNASTVSINQIAADEIEISDFKIYIEGTSPPRNGSLTEHIDNRNTGTVDIVVCVDGSNETQTIKTLSTVLKLCSVTSENASIENSEPLVAPTIDCLRNELAITKLRHERHIVILAQQYNDQLSDAALQHENQIAELHDKHLNEINETELRFKDYYETKIENDRVKMNKKIDIMKSVQSTKNNKKKRVNNDEVHSDSDGNTKHRSRQVKSASDNSKKSTFTEVMRLKSTLVTDVIDNTSGSRSMRSRNTSLLADVKSERRSTGNWKKVTTKDNDDELKPNSEGISFRKSLSNETQVQGSGNWKKAKKSIVDPIPASSDSDEPESTPQVDKVTVQPTRSSGNWKKVRVIKELHSDNEIQSIESLNAMDTDEQDLMQHDSIIEFMNSSIPKDNGEDADTAIALSEPIVSKSGNYKKARPSVRLPALEQAVELEIMSDFGAADEIVDAFDSSMFQDNLLLDINVTSASKLTPAIVDSTLSKGEKSLDSSLVDQTVKGATQFSPSTNKSGNLKKVRTSITSTGLFKSPIIAVRPSLSSIQFNDNAIKAKDSRDLINPITPDRIETELVGYDEDLGQLQFESSYMDPSKSDINNESDQSSQSDSDEYKDTKSLKRPSSPVKIPISAPTLFSEQDGLKKYYFNLFTDYRSLKKRKVVTEDDMNGTIVKGYSPVASKLAKGAM